MSFIHDFLHQEVPKAGPMPDYYRKALFISEAILVVYFLASVALLFFTTGVWLWPPVVILAGTVYCLLNIDRRGPRINLLCFAAIIGAWLTWFVHRFGWSAGSPNILVPILPLVYFNIYEPPRSKIAYFLGLVAFRVLLFAYSLRHTPVATLDRTENLFLQVINSIIPLLILAIDFILFSSSIQASERALTINNQELHREAGTDPLTGLPNRRAMLDDIEQFVVANPEAQFSIAIADIDFFKKVNDTYGHNCGDYTLVKLTELFTEHSGGRYSVCRWGGEEFCFFMPGANIDDAGVIMHDVNFAVERMRLEFEGNEITITITIGVEECDFSSPLEDLLKRADEKLYMGKNSGRNKVVV
jgi:diguanylate cyclase (GGDEF)-like protein